MSKPKTHINSESLFDSAKDLLPGGVNSPVRAFNAVGGQPFFVERTNGPYVYDVDGNKYVDFMGSWGPMILGHADPAVLEAINQAAAKGTSYGAPHQGEIELAKQVKKMMPSVEMMRMVSSGTEATMSAIRLARGVTGRPKIIKFEGCYHGHADSFLIKAGSGPATLGVPNSPGVTPGTIQDTLVGTYNDLESVADLFDDNEGDVAAIIVEPVAGNMNCVLPADDFLPGLRDLCDKYGALLIFDEVITGFRVARGGAQQFFDVKADLTTLGKVLGGGLPVGAFGGKKELMNQMSPVGPVYQAGTLSGNPLAVAAGLATLQHLDQSNTYDLLEEHGAQMETILLAAAKRANVPLTVNRIGSMMGFFLNPGPVNGWSSVCASDGEKFPALFQSLLANGVSIAPSAFEALFVSTVHTSDVLETAAAAFDIAFEKIA